MPISHEKGDLKGGGEFAALLTQIEIFKSSWQTFVINPSEISYQSYITARSPINFIRWCIALGSHHGKQASRQHQSSFCLWATNGRGPTQVESMRSKRLTNDDSVSKLPLLLTAREARAATVGHNSNCRQMLWYRKVIAFCLGTQLEGTVTYDHYYRAEIHHFYSFWAVVGCVQWKERERETLSKQFEPFSLLLSSLSYPLFISPSFFTLMKVFKSQNCARHREIINKSFFSMKGDRQKHGSPKQQQIWESINL